MKKCKSVRDIVNAIVEIIRREESDHPDEVGAEYYFRGECALHGEDKKRGKLSCKFDSYLDRKQCWVDNEHEIYKEALRHSVISFVDDKTMIERVARMQHYQLPTRFADLSANALVAALFACKRGYESHSSSAKVEDGFIRVIKILPSKMKSFTSDIITAIAHLPLVKPERIDVDHPGGIDYLRYEITNERPGFSMNIGGDSDEQLVIKHKDLERQLRDEIKCVWAFKPILNTARIVNQEGIFLAFGCKSHKASLHPNFDRRHFKAKTGPSRGILQVDAVRIDGESKESILHEMRFFGMPEERVYPELSEVCTVIKNRFTK